MIKFLIITTLKQAWRLIKIVIGGTVLVIGIILIFTPGPAIIVIPLGLGILATEFVWARKLLKKTVEHVEKCKKMQVFQDFWRGL